jgi:hypothetical protein
MSDFSYLLIWWVVIIGYYVDFSYISGRAQRGQSELEMISGARNAIPVSGLIGAFYAKRFRLLWLLISIVLATLILLRRLLGLGALKNLMNP